MLELAVSCDPFNHYHLLRAEDTITMTQCTNTVSPSCCFFKTDNSDFLSLAFRFRSFFRCFLLFRTFGAGGRGSGSGE